MPRAIPVPIRRRIWQHLQRGLSAAAIARLLQLPASTVRDLARRWRHDGSAGLPPDYQCCGRPAAPSPAPLFDLVCQLRRLHPSWGAGYLRVRLCAGHGPAVPSVRTLQRWLARAGLGPAPPGRPANVDLGPPRATAPHQRWQVDAVEQLPLANGQQVSWLRVMDECSGAALGTVVFPREPFQSPAAHTRARPLSGVLRPLGPTVWSARG